MATPTVQEKTDLEPTPEMVEAGVRALRESCLLEAWGGEELIIGDIYKAMREERNRAKI